MKSADSDKFIVIAGDTAMVGDGVIDSLALTIGQGRAYTSGNFAILYKSLNEYRELSETYNILAQENGVYMEFLIFESYLPPATYDSLKIIITANYLQIGSYQIPIEMPQGVNPLMKFDQRFDINENRVTEIHLELKPFKSMVRVGDTYHFFRDIEVAEIRYL
ncbi:MAG: hypothetical protein ACE5NG_05275 [bacterium]